MLIRRFYFFRQNCQRYDVLFRFLIPRLIQPAGLTAHGPDGIIESLINIFGGCPHEEAHPAASGLCRSGRTVFPCCLYRARRPARPRRGRADGRRRPCAHGLRRRGIDRAGAALPRARPAAQPVGAAGGGRRVPCVLWPCAADPLGTDVDGAAGHALCPRPRHRGHGQRLAGPAGL